MNSSTLSLRATTLALMLSASVMSTAGAASHAGAATATSEPAKTAAAPAATGMTDAEVRKVDKEGGKLTLRHAEIKNLDMPPMTMVFLVKDKAMLDKLKAGDKIKFRAISEAGKYTVTEVEMAKP